MGQWRQTRLATDPGPRFPKRLSTYRPSTLERKLQRGLEQSWRSGSHGLRQQRAIDICLHRHRSEEQGVVERVERLQSELRHPGIGEFEGAMKRKVELTARQDLA